MRNLLLAILFLIFASHPLISQTEKGTHLVGGQFRLDNLIREGNDLFTVGLSPNYGYFVLKNFAIGARIDLQYLKSGDRDVLSFAGIPFVRYYIPGKSRVRFYLATGVGGGIISVDGDGAGLFEWDIGPGLDFFINEHVALETTFFYEGIQQEGSNYVSSVGFRLGFQVFLFKSDDE